MVAARLGAGRWFLGLAVLALVGCAKKPNPPSEVLPAFTEHRVSLAGDNPFAVAIADFNSDGQPDLLVSFAQFDGVALLLGDGQGGFTASQTWPVGKLVSRGIVARDLNGDGHMDAALASVEWNSVLVYLGDGEGGATGSSAAAGLAPFNVAVGDVDGDGMLDIVVANESNVPALEDKGMVTVLYGNGKGRFPAHLDLEGGSYPADTQIADFDGDGHMDIAVINWKSQDITIFEGRGGRTFAPPRYVKYGEIASAYSIVAADFNSDGKPDIAVGDLVGQVRILYNDGKGAFPKIEMVGAGLGLRCVIAADLNGDGRLDLATANTSAGTSSVLLAKREGGFAPALQIPVGKLPRVVAAGDLNGDGKPDLVVTDSGSKELSILINNGLPAQ